MEPGRLGIYYESIWQPELVHKPAVQAQSLIGVVVGQAVVSPALVQEYCHGIFLREEKSQSKSGAKQTQFVYVLSHNGNVSMVWRLGQKSLY